MDLADKLTWSRLEKVLTKYGSRWKKRCLLDPEFATGFWAFWKSNSDYMKKQGYSVSKIKIPKNGSLHIGQHGVKI